MKLGKIFWERMEAVGKEEPPHNPAKELVPVAECCRCHRRGDVHRVNPFLHYATCESFRMVRLEISGGRDDTLCGDCIRHLVIHMLMSMPYIVRDNPPDLFPYDEIFRSRFGGK